MTLEPIHLMVAGIAILMLIGVGFIFWIVRATIETKRGRTLYMLGEADHHGDDQGDDDDEGLDVR